jgi:transposase-like protein
VKDKDALVACPRCKRWPMALNESKPFWSPRRLFRYVCPCCGNRLDERQTGRAGHPIVPESKKPPGGFPD